MSLKIDWINIGLIKMLCTIGMLISREPEVEVILLVKLQAIIVTLVCYLRYGHRSLWLAPITTAMLCYAMLCYYVIKRIYDMMSFAQFAVTVIYVLLTYLLTVSVACLFTFCRRQVRLNF